VPDFVGDAPVRNDLRRIIAEGEQDHCLVAFRRREVGWITEEVAVEAELVAVIGD
jgi:hypothetical protein